MALQDALEIERKQLEQDIASLEPKKKRLILINELLHLYSPTVVQEKFDITEDSNPKEVRFSGVGITAGVLQVLKDFAPAFATPTEIKKALIDGGMLDSKNLSQMVYSTCKRKSEGNEPEVEVGEKDGNKAFRLMRKY